MLVTEVQSRSRLLNNGMGQMLGKSMIDMCIDSYRSKGSSCSRINFEVGKLDLNVRHNLCITTGVGNGFDADTSGIVDAI